MEWSEFLVSSTFLSNVFILVLALGLLILIFCKFKETYDISREIIFKFIVAYIILFALKVLSSISGQVLPDNYIVDTIIFSNIISIN
jgi:hypothetical protein